VNRNRGSKGNQPHCPIEETNENSKNRKIGAFEIDFTSRRRREREGVGAGTLKKFRGSRKGK